MNRNDEGRTLSLTTCSVATGLELLATDAGVFVIKVSVAAALRKVAMSSSESTLSLESLGRLS
jgi:hypothetical protein